MAESYAVLVEGLADLKDIESLIPDVKLLATRSINTVVERGRTMAARRIRDELNVPASYVAPGGKRLWVSQQATKNNLEGRIQARTRATSLARFVKGQTQLKKEGVTVEVQPGKARFLKRAFLVRLRAGAGSLDTKSNLGLAVRLKPGESLRNKYSSRRLDRGLYLLYGPSVDQIFRARDGSGVAEDISPDLATRLSQEFQRQVDSYGRSR